MRANGARRSSKATRTGFIALNRGKKSITCDLADKAQREALIERIGAADIFVHNLRADVPAKFGIDGADAHQALPAADLCRPRRLRPSRTVEGPAGLRADHPGGGRPDLAERRSVGPEARIGVSIIDLSTGMWTAIGVLAALAKRTATGQGSLVNTSLFESGLMWASNHVAAYSVTGKMPPRQGTGHPSLTPYQAFECSDGPLMICPGNDRLWRKFAEALGHPEWPDEARFKTNVAARASSATCCSA